MNRFKKKEPTLDDPKDRQEEVKGNIAERYQTKIEAVLWIIAAMILIYMTDFIYICIEDTRINR